MTALLTYSLSKQSVNIRAAFLHNVADALGSVAVIVAGTLIILFDWRLIDPLVTLMIAGYILWQSFGEVGGVIRILMLGSPPDLHTEQVLAEMQNIDGVADVHHLHLWQMQEHERAVGSHVAIVAGRWGDADAIKAAVKQVLKDKFGISHATLELECANHTCIDPQIIGHDDGVRLSGDHDKVQTG